MIYTCSYKNFNTKLYRSISISGDRGKLQDYEGNVFPLLAPKKDFWTIWHNNIGKIDEQQNEIFYIEEYYKQVLSKLDPMKIYKELSNSFLLCYEEAEEFCHRHIVAAWLEIFLDIEIKEVKVDALRIDELNRYDLKDKLEEIIKANTNMRGFKSIRALYLFLKGEEFEEKANDAEKNTGKDYSSLRQAACYMRCEADMAEDEYLQKRKLLVNK